MTRICLVGHSASVGICLVGHSVALATSARRGDDMAARVESEPTPALRTSRRFIGFIPDLSPAAAKVADGIGTSAPFFQLSTTALRVAMALRSRPFHNDVNQCLNITLAVVEAMRRIGETRTAITGLEYHGLGPKLGPNAARGQVHVLDRSLWVGFERSGDGAWRNRIGQEFDFTRGRRRPEADAPRTADWVDDFGLRAGACDLDAFGCCTLDESGQRHLQCLRHSGESRDGR